MRKITPKAIWEITKETADQFMKNNSFRLASALAYNTIFSLPPLLFLILLATGKILGDEALSGKLYEQTKGALGSDAATQLQTMITNLNKKQNGGIASIIGIATLVFAATTFFITLQDSLNTIWNIKVKPQSGIMQVVKARTLAFILILGVGFWMLVSFLFV